MSQTQWKKQVTFTYIIHLLKTLNGKENIEHLYNNYAFKNLSPSHNLKQKSKHTN